jgi:hypothetical protein
MGIYQVTCATREPCPQGATPDHVTRVRVEGPEGARVLKVGAARLMVSSGDTLTIGSVTDPDAELRKTRCDGCGEVSLRTRRKDDPDDLRILPAC